MRTLHVIFTVWLMVGISWAKTPSSDWNVVEDIPTGWRIAVVTEFTFPCVFVRASLDEIICRIPQHRWDERGLPETQVSRDRVREVRVDRRNGANALIGGAVGGGAGAILGAMTNTSAKGASAYALGVVGVLLGARIGNGIHLLKGKVIFRATPFDQRTQSSGAQQPDQRFQH